MFVKSKLRKLPAAVSRALIAPSMWPDPLERNLGFTLVFKINCIYVAYIVTTILAKVRE
jgi:hypothetical protein